MVDAMVRVTGPKAGQVAGELRGRLASGGDVGAVEVEKSAELVIAVVSLAFSGVGTAKTIWDWWLSRKGDDGKGDGVAVRIVFGDGEQVDLSQVDGGQFETIIERRTSETG